MTVTFSLVYFALLISDDGQNLWVACNIWRRGGWNNTKILCWVEQRIWFCAFRWSTSICNGKYAFLSPLKHSSDSSEGRNLKRWFLYQRKFSMTLGFKFTSYFCSKATLWMLSKLSRKFQYVERRASSFQIVVIANTSIHSTLLLQRLSFI